MPISPSSCRQQSNPFVRLQAMQPAVVNTSGMQPFDVNTQPAQSCGGMIVSFDNTAAIVGLRSTQASKEGPQQAWANASNPLARLHYATHSEVDFQRFTAAYMNYPCNQQCDGCGACWIVLFQVHVTGMSSCFYFIQAIHMCDQSQFHLSILSSHM